MKIFRNENRKFHQWVNQNPLGFVVNSKPNPGTTFWMAHKVGCYLISSKEHRADSTYHNIKVCSTDPMELVEWFQQNKTSFKGLFRECTKCKPNINQLFNSDRFLFNDPSDKKNKYLEGSLKIVYVNSYERNIQARLDCLKYHGIVCSVCGLNFFEQYGELGRGFIHVHHLKELSRIKATYKVNPITDLVPVCPNCHAMLHRRIPALTIKELKKIMKKNGR
jgi:predicted HNH restriction endonuclease